MLPPQIADRSRPNRLGIIRLGIKTPLVRDGRPVVRQGVPVTIPSEVDYFVLPDTLRAILGESPKTLRVLFPFDDPDLVLSAAFTRYQGDLLTLRCDGRTAIEIPKEGPERSSPCRRTETGCECGAQAKARLNVIVVDGPVGTYQVLIGGMQRIADIWSALRVFHRIFGRLTDIPFTLERVPTEVQVRKEDGSRLARTGWPVQVRCNFTVADALKARGRDLAALPGTATLIEDGDEHDADEPELPATPRRALPSATLEVPPEDAATRKFGGGAAPPDDRPPDAKPGRATLTTGTDEPWTIERCYAAAAGIGLVPAEYARYLVHTYRTTDLDFTAISQQADLLGSLANNPKGVQSFKALVARIAGGASR
jgi:hypothetical protein